MTERPILFNGDMVRAILAGRKTQTRRIVKPARGLQSTWLSMETLHGEVQRFAPSGDDGDWFTIAIGEDRRAVGVGGVDIDAGHIGSMQCPYGRPGDRLWVREAHAFVTCKEGDAGAFRGSDRGITSDFGDWFKVAYLADLAVIDWDPPKVRPSVHMPRWASRLALEVTAIRVERLQAFTLGDVVADLGARTVYDFRPAQDDFRVFAEAWDGINGEGSWKKNPWVWVVAFRVIEGGP